MRYRAGRVTAVRTLSPVASRLQHQLIELHPHKMRHGSRRQLERGCRCDKGFRGWAQSGQIPGNSECVFLRLTDGAHPIELFDRMARSHQASRPRPSKCPGLGESGKNGRIERNTVSPRAVLFIPSQSALPQKAECSGLRKGYPVLSDALAASTPPGLAGRRRTS